MFDSIQRPNILPIEISAAGDNTIIAGVLASDLYIRQIVLVADGGDNEITLIQSDGVTPIEMSVIPMLDGTGVILENTQPDYPFYLALNQGNAFIINLANATSVKGHVIYGLRK